MKYVIILYSILSFYPHTSYTYEERDKTYSRNNYYMEFYASNRGVAHFEHEE